MSLVQTLLARCHAFGAELIPTQHGTLKITAPAPLPEELQRELRQRKGEVLAMLIKSGPVWPCPRCGRPAEIEDVCPSLDGKRTLTLWRCESCQTYGVTPDTIRQPPLWVRKREQ